MKDKIDIIRNEVEKIVEQNKVLNDILEEVIEEQVFGKANLSIELINKIINR